MKTKIVKISYKKEHHKVDLNDYATVYELRTKVHKIFTKLPFLYELVNEDNQGMTLNQQDLEELKNSQNKDIRLVIKSLEIERSQAIDILNQSYFESNSSKIHKSSLIYQGDINQSFQKDGSMLKQIVQKQKPLKKQDKKEQNIKELPVKQQEKKEQILNEDIQCDGCFAFPIKGTIYKCLYCPNYDLCSKCEKTKHSYHPLLKITQKDQYPCSLQVKFSHQSKKIMQAYESQAKLQEEKAKEQYKRQLFEDKDKKEIILNASQVKIKKVKCKNFVAEIIDSCL